MPTSQVSEPNDLLFTYGTLLQASGNPYALYLQNESTALGPGWFPGLLYDLGLYPGAVHDQIAQTWVHGGIFRLHLPEDALRVLDAYEGVNEPTPEYARHLLDVQTEKGTLTCWVYLYQHPPQNFPLIPSGNYVEYWQGKQNESKSPR